ncbi:MAG: alpha/beta hydrolase [Pirellulales bacterium]
MELTPAAQPETVPGEIGGKQAGADGDDEVEIERPQSLKIAEFGNACSLYVPNNYTDDVPHGLVILLHPAGGFDKATLKTSLEAWLPICRRDHLILLQPTAKDKEGVWGRDDLEFSARRSTARPKGSAWTPRIVTLGWEEGGSLAMRAAAQYPERIRAAALVNGMLVGPLPENEPQTPLAYFIAAEKSLPNLPQIKAGLKPLRERFPVTYRELSAGDDDLSTTQREEFARWIDMLDRI